MKFHHFNAYFFLVLLLLTGAGVFLIFQPFLTAILIAAILAVFFSRPFESLKRIFRGSDAWAAFFTCALVALIVVVPFSIVLALAVNEANTFYHSGQGWDIVKRGAATIEKLPFLDAMFPSGEGIEKFSGSVQEIGKGAISVLGAAYQGAAEFVLWLFVLFFSLFYFLIDGRRMVSYLMRISPLRDEHEKLLFRRFISISRATLKGTLVVGIVQGALGAFAFFVAGVPSPIIWGIMMAVLSLIPMVGAGLVWFPASIIFLVTGNVWEGVFLLSFGIGVISLIDNILRPKLVGRDTEMHPLLVFFATIGGITLFGISGFLIGPIVVSLFMALAGIYMTEYSAELKEYNHNGKV